MDAAPMIEGQVCKPNISAAGRRVRRRVGYIGLLVAAGLLGAAIAMQWAWYLRALVCFPVALSGFGFLQVRRNTCVAHARTGTFEHDDMSATKVEDQADVAASRKVAAGIQRDVMLIAIAAALVASSTALLR